MERVEANRVRTGFAERAVKAEGCSCTIVTKHQRARSGDVGIGVAVAALSPIKAPGRVRIAPVSAKTLRTRHMRRSLTCRPASAAWATIGVRLWILCEIGLTLASRAKRRSAPERAHECVRGNALAVLLTAQCDLITKHLSTFPTLTPKAIPERARVSRGSFVPASASGSSSSVRGWCW